MKNRIEIKVFKLKDNINLPISSHPSTTANCCIGDLLISYDNKHVYAKDWTSAGEPSYVLLLNELSFFESNPTLFDNISGN